MKPLAFTVTVILLITCLWLEGKRLIIKPFPPTTFDSSVDEFKYGSIGAEVNGFPYVIWRELPTIYKDQIPKGWSSFGFLYEPQHKLPVGISVRRTGILRVGFNCAACHTARINISGKSVLLLGAPAAQLDVQSYLLFLARAAGDRRLTADAVIDSARQNGHPLDGIERQVLRYLIFPNLKKEAAALQDEFLWMHAKPPHGPGRTDAGNAWRSRWGMHPERDAAVGTVDFPSVWDQRIRLHGWFHWDGDNNSLDERNYSAALAAGATDWLLDRRAIGKISNWLLDLRPPKFPFAMDRQRAAVGRQIYVRESCAICHDPGAPRMGQVTDLATIGTDAQRALLFNNEMVRRFRDVGEKYSWRFSHYRSTHGYANVPLDGIWARAPYLHNGSVPTLAALLTAPRARPTHFFRGCTEFDPVHVGFSCTQGFQLDTGLVGNGNGGHDYGTKLSPEDKAALLEYLKTL